MSEAVMEEVNEETPVSEIPAMGTVSAEDFQQLVARVAELEDRLNAMNWLHDQLLNHHIQLAQTKQLLDNPQTRAGLIAQLGGGPQS